MASVSKIMLIASAKAFSFGVPVRLISLILMPKCSASAWTLAINFFALRLFRLGFADWSFFLAILLTFKLLESLSITMRTAGVEPARLSALAPQAKASANLFGLILFADLENFREAIQPAVDEPQFCRLPLNE